MIRFIKISIADNIKDLHITSIRKKNIWHQKYYHCGKNLARYAILVLDMLNDFIKGSLKCERALEIIPNIRTLLDIARNNQIPIFYCVDEHLPTDSYELELWGPHAMKGTVGQQIADDWVQAFSEEDHLLCLEYIKKIYGADIKKINKIIELLVANKQ